MPPLLPPLDSTWHCHAGPPRIAGLDIAALVHGRRLYPPGGTGHPQCSEGPVLEGLDRHEWALNELVRLAVPNPSLGVRVGDSEPTQPSPMQAPGGPCSECVIPWLPHLAHMPDPEPPTLEALAAMAAADAQHRGATRSPSCLWLTCSPRRR